MLEQRAHHTGAGAPVGSDRSFFTTWACERCGYTNFESANECEMCAEPRYDTPAFQSLDHGNGAALQARFQRGAHAVRASTLFKRGTRERRRAAFQRAVARALALARMRELGTRRRDGRLAQLKTDAVLADAADAEAAVHSLSRTTRGGGGRRARGAARFAAAAWAVRAGIRMSGGQPWLGGGPPVPTSSLHLAGVDGDRAGPSRRCCLVRLLCCLCCCGGGSSSKRRERRERRRARGARSRARVETEIARQHSPPRRQPSPQPQSRRKRKGKGSVTKKRRKKRRDHNAAPPADVERRRSSVHNAPAKRHMLRRERHRGGVVGGGRRCRPPIWA